MLKFKYKIKNFVKNETQKFCKIQTTFLKLEFFLNF